MRKMNRVLASALALAMVATTVPVQTEAATAMEFKKVYGFLYENGDAEGNYLYTLQGLSKGQTVKWYVSGPGSEYVKMKYTSKKVTGKTTSNRLRVQTKGAPEAKNAKVKLKAKVYSKKGKWIKSITTSGKVRVRADQVALSGTAFTESVLAVNKAYTLGLTMEPVNSTNKVVWSAVDSNGNDVTSYISVENNTFTAPQPGKYTITAQTFVGTKEGEKDTATVTVADVVESVKQVGVDKVEITFSSDVSQRVKLADYKITAQNGSTDVAKEVTYSGNVATLQTYAAFKDGETYTITVGDMSKTFVASAGIPTSLKVLTTTVVANQKTELRWAIYDKNGIDVTAVYPGTIIFEENMDGSVEDGKITMKVPGSSGTIKATFTPDDKSVAAVSGTCTVTCVEESEAQTVKFTTTKTEAEPNYKDPAYVDNTEVFVGQLAYAHVRGLNSNGDMVTYSEVKYESGALDSLIIDATTGKMTPIKTGTVPIVVTVTQGSKTYRYSFTVTIKDAPRLDSVNLDTSTIEMSNISAGTNYVKYLNVSAKGTDGKDFPMDAELGVIALDSGVKTGPKVEYNEADNRVSVVATNATVGTYNYTLAIKIGEVTKKTTFTVKVVEVPVSGKFTFALDVNKKNVDVALDKDTAATGKTNTICLEKYRNGIFAGYAQFGVESITKDGKFYTTDLTAGSVEEAKAYPAIDKLTLTTLAINSDVAKKAQVGTYTVNITYIDEDTMAPVKESISFQVTDSNPVPSATVVRTSSKSTCSNALTLVNDCINATSGIITDCEVLGENKKGSEVSTMTNGQYHIKSITVTEIYEISGGKKISMNHVIEIGRTLTNR